MKVVSSPPPLKPAQAAWSWTWRNVLYAVGINPDFTVEAVRAAVQSALIGTGAFLAGCIVSAFLANAFASPQSLGAYFKSNVWTLIVMNLIAPYVRARMATTKAAKSGDLPSTPPPPSPPNPPTP